MSRAAAIFQALALLVVIASAHSALEPYYDSKCLLCICKALGGGTCEAGGECNAKNCYGPFRITQQYWMTAGSPVQPGDNALLPGAFRRCVEEPFCAVRTIQSQMSQGALKDFDRDGRISCLDLHIAHKFGRNYEKIPDLSSGLFPYLKKCLDWKEPVNNVPSPKPITSSHAGPRGASIGSSTGTRDSSSGTPELSGSVSHGGASLDGGSSRGGMASRGTANNASREANGGYPRNTPVRTPRGYNSNAPVQNSGGSQSERGR